MVKLRPMLLAMAVIAVVCTTMLFANRAMANRNEAPLSANGCSGSDCIIYDISTQSQCTQVGPLPPSYDARWGSKGLSLGVDQTILGGRIVAFKLQWFNGTWSEWYVPGVNDVGPKFNTSNGMMVRWWAYFYDHSYTYIICKN